MLSAESFQTFSLRTLPEGLAIARILVESIRAVEPGAAVERFVNFSGDVLNVAGREYDLADFRRVNLLGIGKGSVAMSAALCKILGERLQAGLVVTKHGSGIHDFPFAILEGGHPVPDVHSLEAGKKTLEFVSSLGPGDLLLCLISGGGSALVAAPRDRLSLEDTQALTSALLASGASINEINSLRRRLERLKGGGLVKASNGATIVSLILSDVVGNPLEVIASGPTAPDPTFKKEALGLVDKYALRGKIPASILSALNHTPETPKPGDPIFKKVQNVIIGSNLLAARGALAQAEKEGFHPFLLGNDLQGEARLAASKLVDFLVRVRKTSEPVAPPACIVVGGETTVTIRGNGKGGRNTEMALAAVAELAGLPDVTMVSLATDGEDGPTDSAGAVVTGETFLRAAGLGMHPQDFLDRNDSYAFFSTLDDLLRPGSTGTNVNDLVFLFIL